MAAKTNGAGGETRLAVSLEEAAELVGISRATFYKLLSAGEAPPTALIGRRRVVPLAGLQAWLDRATVGASAA